MRGQIIPAYWSCYTLSFLRTYAFFPFGCVQLKVMYIKKKLLEDEEIKELKDKKKANELKQEFNSFLFFYIYLLFNIIIWHT